MDKQIALITNSSYQYHFLKVAVLNCSINGVLIISLFTIRSVLAVRGEQE